MIKRESIRKIKKKIEREGNDEEREINKLGKNILKLVDNLYVGEKYKKGWSSFEILKTAFKDNLQRYEGDYSKYFEDMYKRIEEQERQALGYRLY